jgi:heat shock protein HtpX
MIGLVVLVVGGIFFVLAGPRVIPKLVLRMYKAKPVAVKKDTQLFAIVEELTKRAGLPRISKLFYIPSQMINAFATGTCDNALIGVTYGIL